MILPVYYLLQVMLCSAILFLYYHVALRNRVFHQWNRFYLLAAVILSLALPAIDWNLQKTEDTAPVATIIMAITDVKTSVEAAVVAPSHSYSASDLVLPVYLVICALLFILLAASLMRIIFIIRRNEAKRTGDVYFIDADISGTPFSFFQYIFWNREIDLSSDTGRRIASHEIVHVKEWHSADKIFIQLVLVFFWINPIFWLMRRELRSIHEFIADKRSAGEEGGAALAEMILESSYQKNFSFITNQFFNTSIKRRIAMITKSNHKVNYFTRVLALPVITLIAFAFTVRSHANENTDKNVFPAETVSTNTESSPEPANDTVPQVVMPTRVHFLKNGNAMVIFKTGVEIMTWDEAVKKKYIAPKEAERQKNELKKNNSPLLVFNGEVRPEHTEKSSEILKVYGATVTILTPDEAVKKYGGNARNGAVEITGNLRDEESEPVFVKVEQEATIDKGKWKDFITEHILPISEKASDRGISGTYKMTVQLTITPDGTVSEAKLTDDAGFSLSKEVEAAMLKSPKWEPAMQNGRKVHSYIKQPVTIVSVADAPKNDVSQAPAAEAERIKKMSLQQLLGLKDTDEVVSCTFSIGMPNGDIFEVKNTGNEFSSKARELIGMTKPGSKLFIDAIVIKKEDGSPKKMPAKFYQL